MIPVSLLDQEPRATDFVYTGQTKLPKAAVEGFLQELELIEEELTFEQVIVKRCGTDVQPDYDDDWSDVGDKQFYEHCVRCMSKGITLEWDSDGEIVMEPKKVCCVFLSLR